MTKTIYNNIILKPISKETARAMGWLDKYRVSKSIVIKEKCPTVIKYPSEYTVCPKCKVRVQLKNLKKHYSKSHNITDKAINKSPTFKTLNIIQNSDKSLVCCLLCLSKRPSVGISNTIIKSIDLENHISKAHKSQNNPTLVLTYYKAIESRRKNEEVKEKLILDTILKHEKREKLLSANTDYLTQPKYVGERVFRDKTTGFLSGRGSDKIKIIKLKPKITSTS